VYILKTLTRLEPLLYKCFFWLKKKSHETNHQPPNPINETYPETYPKTTPPVEFILRMAFSSASMSRSNMRRCDALFFTAVKSQLQWLGSDEGSFPENLGTTNWGGYGKKWATQFSEGEN